MNRLIAIALLVLIWLSAAEAKAMLASSTAANVAINVQMIYCSRILESDYVKQDTDVIVRLYPHMSGQSAPPIEIHLKPTDVSQNGFGIAFNIGPGDYGVTVDWKSGGPLLTGADFLLTVLPNQPRVIGAIICDTLTHHDSYRYAAGVLSIPAASAVMLNEHGNKPVAIDGSAYYANGLSPGKLTLRIYFADGFRYCDFSLSDGTKKNWMYEGIIFDITPDRIRKAIPGNCG